MSSGSVGGIVQARELRVVSLGDVDSGRLVQGDDEVQEIHRVEVHLVPEVCFRIDRLALAFRRDARQSGADQACDLFSGHVD
jgi:hypothetical protein